MLQAAVTLFERREQKNVAIERFRRTQQRVMLRADFRQTPTKSRHVEAILAAQFFIGCGIGVHFLGVTWGELTRVVLAGIAYVLVLAVLAAGFTGLVTWAGLGNPVEAFLAFAPGGQAEMTVLAIVTGADLGFVITHHLTRIVLVIVGAPLVAGFMARRRKD